MRPLELDLTAFRSYDRATVDLRDVWQCFRQLVGQQGEMGAGENHNVELMAARMVEHGFDRPVNIFGGDRHPSQFRFRQLDELGAAVPNDRAVGGEPIDQVIHIGLTDGRLSAQHADHSR